MFVVALAGFVLETNKHFTKQDIQGIPWDMMATTRDKYRQSRLQRYANFENVPNSGRTSEKA